MRKFNGGRILCNEDIQIWGYGGIERESENFFFMRVHQRDKRTLVNLIEHYIVLGTQIIPDDWKAYSDLENLEYIHSFMNHSIEFVNSQDRTVHAETCSLIVRQYTVRQVS